jgi:anti-anti-sigma factor
MLISSLQNSSPHISITRGRCSSYAGLRALTRSHVIAVEGSLRVPIDSGLRERVQTMVRRGVRMLRLDLSRLSSIDAAGVGELVAVSHAMNAAGGMLYVSHAGRRVRHVLETTGVYSMLTCTNASHHSW